MLTFNRFWVQTKVLTAAWKQIKGSLLHQLSKKHVLISFWMTIYLICVIVSVNFALIFLPTLYRVTTFIRRRISLPSLKRALKRIVCRRCTPSWFDVWLTETRWIWNRDPRRLLRMAWAAFAVRCGESIVAGLLGNRAQFQLLLSPTLKDARIKMQCSRQANWMAS